MKRFSRAFGFTVALIASCVGIACEAPPPVGNTNTNNSTAAANTNLNSTPTAPVAPTPNPNAERLAMMSPVTMPVLDALFYNDEAFANELKSKVNLTDEQITRLKEVARQQTQSLAETEDQDNYNGSTVAAREAALREIRAIVGDEKATQLVGFVTERMNNGGDVAGASGGVGDANNSNAANNVPTDTRIVVNAPAYRMDLFENGQLVKTYKIGIGYPEFPLPQGMRKADTIIYNPTWTPPDEAWVRASNKIEAGKKVDAGNPLNPLGPIKIPIGLPSLIHGGKQAARLGTFASHGCVGLTDNQVETFARDLAKLTKTDLTDEQIAEYQKDKKQTKNVKLNAPVPVELRYDTIVVEDGKLKIFRDVYERGTNTEENLSRVLQAYGVDFNSLTPQEQARIREGLKQMSRDAQGNAVDENNNNANSSGGNNNTNANSNKANQNKNTNLSANNSSGDNNKVTRTIKGAKEVTIELAALQGKGYPAPVNLDNGGSGKATTNAKPAAKTATSNKRR